ncbi:hypothetical protein BJ742DRAFT_745195 [Cladochytrium replicatum]|nr:hypothetical protein BJ742DRAFT_745195 [Cladochytrium replicatum]
MELQLFTEWILLSQDYFNWEQIAKNNNSVGFRIATQNYSQIQNDPKDVREWERLGIKLSKHHPTSQILCQSKSKLKNTSAVTAFENENWNKLTHHPNEPFLLDQELNSFKGKRKRGIIQEGGDNEENYNDAELATLLIQDHNCSISCNKTGHNTTRSKKCSNYIGIGKISNSNLRGPSEYLEHMDLGKNNPADIETRTLPLNTCTMTAQRQHQVCPPKLKLCPILSFTLKSFAIDGRANWAIHELTRSSNPRTMTSQQSKEWTQLNCTSHGSTRDFQPTNFVLGADPGKEDIRFTSSYFTQYHQRANINSARKWQEWQLAENLMVWRAQCSHPSLVTTDLQQVDAGICWFVQYIEAMLAHYTTLNNHAEWCWIEDDGTQTTVVVIHATTDHGSWTALTRSNRDHRGDRPWMFKVMFV